MSSTREKALAAAVALVVGVAVGYSISVPWGWAASFAVYVVMVIDNALDRLDELKKMINSKM